MAPLPKGSKFVPEFIPDEPVDPLLPQESAPPAEMKSRRDRVLEAIKGMPAAAKRVGGKALDFQYRATTQPVETVKALLTPGGEGEDALRGFGQGASLGFLDELEGVRGAYSEARRPMIETWPDGARLEGLTDQPQSISDAYRRARDQRRHDDAIARERSPDATAAAQFGGAMLLPVRGMTGATVAGGAYGLGASDADLTKGEARGAGNDAAEGAAMGFLTAAAAKPLASLGRYGKTLESRGIAAEEANVAKAAARDYRGERSGLASDTGAVNRRLAIADEVLANPQAYTPEMVAQAHGFVNSELGIATRRLTAQNALDDLPGSMGQLQERRAAMDAAAAAAEPAAVSATTKANLSKSWTMNELAPRLDRLANNAFMSAATQPIGGAPLKTASNLANAPLTQVRAGQRLQNIAAPGKAMSAAQPGIAQTLADYLRPRDEKEREEQGVDWFLSGGGSK